MEDIDNAGFEPDEELVKITDELKQNGKSSEVNNDVKNNAPAAPVRKKRVSFQEPTFTTATVARTDDVIYEVTNDDVSNSTKASTERENASQGNLDGEIRIPEISDLWWNDVALEGGTKPLKQPKNEFEKVQMNVRFYIDHIAVRVFGVFLIFLDIILMIMDLSLGTKPPPSQKFYDGMALALSCVFMMDLFLRIFAYGLKEFFTNIWEVADGIIIVVTFAVTIFYTVLDQYIEELSGQGLGRLVVFARLLRVVRVARIIYTHYQVKKSSRRTVSQNKRRYQKDGFDLDLTYVTDDVIAMSFPSSGLQSYFRNPIEEVREFFETKHKGKYKIYNLCSERSYDAKHFDDRVYRVMIDDHNVPTISDLLDFIVDAKKWMNSGKDHVIAIHCKGGKGRTGTIVCSWLIENGMFQTAKDSLEYFGLRRTDMNMGQTFQGVETASQIRYVGYFERIKRDLGGKAPEEKVLRLTRVIINSIAGVGRGNGSDLSMQIILHKEEVLMCKLAENYNCQAVYNLGENNVTCFLDSPTLSGDVKFRFTSTESSVPRGYDDCAFYFWLNTGFVDDNKVTLKREQLDNPHKKKTWHVFKEDFSVQLIFEEAYHE